MDEKQQEFLWQLECAIRDATKDLTPMESALVIASSMRKAGLKCIIEVSAMGSYSIKTAKERK